MNKKYIYSVLLKEVPKGYYVYIPEWDIHTQGDSLANAIKMAKDSISIMGIEYEDEGIEFPHNKNNNSIKGFDYKTLVEVDIEKYRKKLKQK